MTVIQFKARVTQVDMTLAQGVRALIKGGYLPSYLEKFFEHVTWTGWYLSSNKHGQRKAANYLNIPFHDHNGHPCELDIVMDGTLIDEDRCDRFDFENYPSWIITISVRPSQPQAH